MNFAMAFTEKDVDQVQRWLSWVEELGWNPAHRLFLMAFKGMKPALKTNIPFTVVPDEQGIMGDWADTKITDVRDASGPNSMFRQFAWYFHPINGRNLGPYMWIEPDCVPTRPGWHDELAAEYATCGKPFMAAFVKGVGDLYPDHPTGNMILPERAAEMSRLLMLPSYVQVIGNERTVEYAFDVACAADVLPQCHFTKKLQHVFRGPKFETMDHLARLDPAACLFHTDKDGGLINLLRRQRSGEKSVLEAPKMVPSTAVLRDTTGAAVPEFKKPRVHTYFRPCVDSEALAEQKRILAIWEKNWREHGWEPVILTEEHAKKHHFYKDWKMAFESFPTVSPKEYEMAAWLRWIAMTALGENTTLLLVDYDCLNNGFSLTNLVKIFGPLSELPLILSDNNPVPCAVAGTSRQFEQAIRAFMNCPPGEEQGHPHLSDMLAVQKLKFPAKDVCREVEADGWEKAPLIHFSHRRCGKERSKHMEAFLDPTHFVSVEAPSVLKEIVNPEWVNSDAPVIEHNLGVITVNGAIEALVELSKKDGFAKGRIVKQLRKAGLIPKK